MAEQLLVKENACHWKLWDISAERPQQAFDVLGDRGQSGFAVKWMLSGKRSSSIMGYLN